VQRPFGAAVTARAGGHEDVLQEALHSWLVCPEINGRQAKGKPG
jgi:hypothetical protein